MDSIVSAHEIQPLQEEVHWEMQNQKEMIYSSLKFQPWLSHSFCNFDFPFALSHCQYLGRGGERRK